MRRGLTSLNKSESVWWMNFRREAEMEAWKRLGELFPRLNKFEGPAGNEGFRFHADRTLRRRPTDNSPPAGSS